METEITERRKAIEQLINEYGLNGKARELHGLAGWYQERGSTILTDYYLYAYRCFADFLSVVRDECTTLEDIEEVLDCMMLDSKTDFERFQEKDLMRFAEFATIKYETLKEISSHIERNK